MGLYGSPDLGNLYTEEKEIKKKKRIKFSIQTIVLLVLYLLLMMNNDNRVVMTASYVGVLAIVFFIINIAKMGYKLIKKQSVNREVVKILICIALFIISGMII